jgi:hypothetical protein
LENDVFEQHNVMYPENKQKLEELKGLLGRKIGKLWHRFGEVGRTR